MCDQVFESMYTYLYYSYFPIPGIESKSFGLETKAESREREGERQERREGRILNGLLSVENNSLKKFL